MTKTHKRNQPKRKNKGKKQTTMGIAKSSINYPLLPNSFKVKLEYQEEYLTDNATAGATEKFGLNHWAGRTPGYGSTLYTLYKYAQVLRVDYTFRVSSTVTAPFEAVLVPAPYQSSTTFQVLAAYRGRKIQSSSGINSMNKVQLRASYYPSQVEGVPTMYDKATWYIESDMNATAPQDTNTHSVWLGIRPCDTSTTGSYAVVCTISYHMHYFSPINTVLSALEQDPSFVDYEPEMSVKPDPRNRLNSQTSNTSKIPKKI